jgi:uncharacterized membrane protein
LKILVEKQSLNKQVLATVDIAYRLKKCLKKRGGTKMENNSKTGIDNKVLDGLAWGSFFILLGLVWFVSSSYSIDAGAYVAIGVGIILIAVNLIRLRVGTKISKFSLFIGLIAFALGGAGILGYSLDLVPMIIILIGLFIVAEGLEKATRHSQHQ